MNGLPLRTRTALLFCAVALAAFSPWSCAEGGGASRAAKPLPEFRLTDQRGRPFDSSTLRGHAWVAAFIFTRCPSTCPRMSARMAVLQDTLPPGAWLVSISVDPDYDTPEVLAAYAGRWKAREERWIFLTGSRETIYPLARESFLLPLDEAEESDGDALEGEMFIHSSRLVLVDTEGRVRGYYDSAENADMESLARDAARLEGPRWLARMPACNAVLNALAALLLLAGFGFIRRKHVAAHRACMLAAFAVSLAFLASYLFYHYHAGATPFAGRGWLRALYFCVLISHTVLAALVPFLALWTLGLALRGRFERHRKMARWTLPLWLYVSVTGVLIYWMLYRLRPPGL